MEQGDTPSVVLKTLPGATLPSRSLLGRVLSRDKADFSLGLYLMCPSRREPKDETMYVLWCGGTSTRLKRY